MFEGESIFRLFEVLPYVLICVFGARIIWIGAFSPVVRFGMNRNNPPLRGSVAVIGRVFVALGGLYALIVGGKVLMDRLAVMPRLSQHLDTLLHFPFMTIFQFGLALMFLGMAVNGVFLLIHRESDWKTRTYGAGLFLVCGVIASAIAYSELSKILGAGRPHLLN